MKNYGWVITKDLIENGKNIGLMGPHDVKFSIDEIKTKGEKFELWDDDNNCYYKGYLLGGDGFEPLDDFGKPGAGCVKILFKNGFL